MEVFVILVLLLGSTVAQETGLEEKHIKIIGTQKTFPYTNFTGIPMAKRHFLESIHLELVEFEPDYLVSELEGCLNLKYLTLRDTHWKQKRFTRKVHLPNLDLFRIYLRNWDYKSSSAEEILSFYFVYVSVEENNRTWDEFTPGLDFNSEIDLLTSIGEVDVVVFMLERLIIRLLPFDISPYYKYRDLVLQNTVLNVTNLKRIERGLTLQDVKIVGGGMAEIFAKSTKARILTCDFLDSVEMETIDMALLPPDLRLFGITFGNVWTSIPDQKISNLKGLILKNSKLNATNLPYFETMYHLSLTNTAFSVGNISFISRMAPLETLELDSMANFDISILGSMHQTLKRVQLSNMAVAQSAPLKLERMDTLILNNSKLDAQVLSGFNETFQNLKSLEVYGSFEYMASVLMKSLQTTVRYIRIYLRGDQRIRQKPEFREVNAFLNSADVPLYATSIRLHLAHKNTTNETGYFAWKSEGYPDDFTQNPNLRDITMYCYIIPLFLVCFIGVVGNIVSGVVLSTKEMRSSTSCILLGLTLCDTTILTTYIWSILYFGLKFAFMFWKFAIPEYKFPVFWFDISLESAQESDNIQSLILYPLNKTAYTGSVYMTVLVTMERYVAVCWPLRSKRILTMKKAMVVTLSILAFSILLNIPRWIEAQTNTVVEVVSHNKPIRWKLNRKTASTDLLLYTDYREFYHGWIWVTLMYGIPIPLLIGLNLKIWIQLKRILNNKDGLATSRNAHKEEELASLTKLLICVATIFIICNIINGVVSLTILWYYPGDWEPADIEIFSCIPLIINSSVNFIIYCLMGKKFRGILITIFQKQFTRNWIESIPRSLDSRNRNAATVTRFTSEATQCNTQL